MRGTRDTYRPKHVCRLRILLLVVALLLSQVVYISNPVQPVAGAAAVMDGNLPPVVEIVPDVSNGKAPLLVHFDGEVSDEDGEIVTLEWDFEGDGTFEVVKSIPGQLKGNERLLAVKNELKKEFVYTKTGTYHVLLRVTDDKLVSSVSSVTIQVYSDTPWLGIVPCSTEYEYMARFIRSCW